MNKSTIEHLKILGSLFLLLALTTAVAFVPLGSWNWIPNLVLSVLMTGLIILFFMRVRYSAPLIWLTYVAGFVWLSLLLFLIILDYISRPWPQ
jgi:cytochrome c oxidase subunit IV